MTKKIYTFFFAVFLSAGSAMAQTNPFGNNDFIFVQGGTFLMGAQCHDPNAPNYDADLFEYDGHSDEEPLHQVTVSSFWIGKYEVTVCPPKPNGNMQRVAVPK